MTLLTGGLGGPASSLFSGGFTGGAAYGYAVTPAPPGPTPVDRGGFVSPTREYEFPPVSVTFERIKRHVPLKGSVLYRIENRLDLVGTKLMKVLASLEMKGTVLEQVETQVSLGGAILNDIQASIHLKGTILQEIVARFRYQGRYDPTIQRLVKLLDDLDTVDTVDGLEVLETLNGIIDDLNHLERPNYIV